MNPITNLQPVGANEAEFFVFQAGATIASNSTTNNANKATDQVQVLPDSFFCLMGFTGSTNYDSVGGSFTVVNVNSGNPLLYGPPKVANNFEVSIRQDNNYLFSGIPMPQACICSNGYYAGHQMVWPSLYKPLTQFQFEFYNTAQTLLDDSTGSPGAAISLVIQFGLFGYNVPVENLKAFLSMWPSYQAAAMANGQNWIKQFTSMDLPGLTG